MTDWPKFAIVGAGAIGGLVGAMLARAGAPVTLIGRRAFVDAVARDGLKFESGGKTETLKVTASSDPGAVKGARYVLVCVKSGDSEDAAKAIAPHLDADAVVLNLQNGVGNAERIRKHVRQLVAPVLVYTASQMPAPGHIRHTGGNKFVVSNFAGADEVARLFNAAGIASEVSKDVDTEMWSKLFMNATYNSVCALTQQPYGRMCADPEIRALMSAIGDEVIAVAAAKGIRIPDNVPRDMFKLADVMPTQVSSTAQDLAKGKPTEIDFLNGYVAREGAAAGIATPLNRALTALVKLRENATR
ncbi:MAG: 2-dehydropantoate 2-reductase [Pseudolabrys sp.]|nr:2-dehydropantoate 2-reductase [Pseudolabrys sp.]